MIGALFAALSLLTALQQPERLADIQVHGNTLTPDVRVVELAGVQIGDAVEPTTVEAVATRLRAARVFQRVEVLKRFASIDDLSQIALVIVVDEGPVSIGDRDAAGATVRKRRGPDLMWLPILGFEDGYGFTYGVQASLPEPLGAGSRISFPATWGGERRAAVEVEVPLSGPVVTRVRGGAGISRRTNPFFDASDERRRLWARVEHDLGRSVRIGAIGASEQVSFLGDSDRVGQLGLDATVDTRVDPFLARNAVYGRVAWDLLRFDRAADARRVELEGRAYLGLPRQAIVVVRGLRQDANRPLPPALQPLLGGSATLRGFEAGSGAGDTLVAASAELRLPLTSPLSIGKLGVSAFLDLGTAYDEGQRLRGQTLDRGVGAGVWLSAALIRANVYIAHGIGASTRVHFTVTGTF